MHKSLARGAPRAIKGAVPLHMVTAKAAKGFLKAHPGLPGFAGREGELVPLMRGARPAAWVLGLGDAADPFAAAAFAEKLPDGLYRLGALPPGFAPKIVALSWVLGTYGFDRYKASRRSAPRLV